MAGKGNQAGAAGWSAANPANREAMRGDDMPNQDNGNEGRCYGCGAPVPNVSGSYYCDSCIETQLRDERDERQAFEDFHAFADAVARRTR